MINNMINGFCMAIADSVPGVSGGTIAYIMGFYQKLVDSVHDLFGKDREKRNVAARYLIKLGIGWALGFLSAMLVLAAMFAKNIYFMSSLFLGLSIAALPFIIHSERKVIAGKYLNIVYTFLGFAIVAGLTLLKNSGHIGLLVNFHDAGAVDLIYVFIAGVIAVTAMILPGISGSTMLLIMGVYLQAVEGIHEVLTLDFSFPAFDDMPGGRYTFRYHLLDEPDKQGVQNVQVPDGIPDNRAADRIVCCHRIRTDDASGTASGPRYVELQYRRTCAGSSHTACI